MLRDKQLLPVVCFVFSRKRCDDYLELVKGMDLNSEEDKHYISQFFRQALSRLNESDKQLQQVRESSLLCHLAMDHIFALDQVLNMQEMAKRGIAIHHSGVLPILRESVELLFQTGRIKVLFATETFASEFDFYSTCQLRTNGNVFSGDQHAGSNCPVRFIAKARWTRLPRISTE